LVPYSEPFVRHHPWFDSAMDLFNYLAFYLGLTVFIITLAFLAIKAALYRAAMALSLWLSTPTPSYPNVIYVPPTFKSNIRSSFGPYSGIRLFSTSAIIRSSEGPSTPISSSFLEGMTLELGEQEYLDLLDGKSLQLNKDKSMS